MADGDRLEHVESIVMKFLERSGEVYAGAGEDLQTLKELRANDGIVDEEEESEVYDDGETPE